MDDVKSEQEAFEKYLDWQVIRALREQLADSDAATTEMIDRLIGIETRLARLDWRAPTREESDRIRKEVEAALGGANFDGDY